MPFDSDEAQRVAALTKEAIARLDEHLASPTTPSERESLTSVRAAAVAHLERVEREEREAKYRATISRHNLAVGNRDALAAVDDVMRRFGDDAGSQRAGSPDEELAAQTAFVTAEFQRRGLID